MRSELRTLKLLDTNIFIYARGKAHRYKEPCRKIIESLEDPRHDLSIDTEVLQKLLYVYDYRGERGVGIELVKDLEILLPSPIPITGVIISQTANLMREYADLVPRDAIHAAVVIIEGLEGIISADKIFDSMSEIKRIDPIDFVKGRGSS